LGAYWLGPAPRAYRNASGRLDFYDVGAMGDAMDARVRVLQALLDTAPLDVATIVFMHTDYVQHFAWATRNVRSGRAEDHLEDVVRAAYVETDRRVERLLALTDDDAHVIVLSDHGFGGVKKWINLNVLLEQLGFLRWKARPRPTEPGRAPESRQPASSRLCQWLSLGSAVTRKMALRLASSPLGQRIRSRVVLSNIDWSRTRAYAEDGLTICINVRGRESDGCVAPGAEYERLRNDVGQALREVRMPGSGDRPFRAVVPGEEILQPSSRLRPPDLYAFSAVPAYVSRVHSAPSTAAFESPGTQPRNEEGFHARDGVMILSGPHAQQGGTVEGASIVDVAPTLLAMLGIRLPPSMDGEVLSHALADLPCAPRHAAQPESDQPQERGTAYSAAEEAELERRLRDLGYS